MVPQGYLPGVKFVVFVPPENYYGLQSEAERSAIGRVVGKVNKLLEEKSFICVGPGRWGTNNVDLGVYVSYADIHRSAALIELSGSGFGPDPEPSLGTHFFQDLMEAQIYPLAVLLDKEDTIFNRTFFYDSPNCLSEYLSPADAEATCVRLIDVEAVYPGSCLNVVMDDEKGEAVAFISAK
jgi:hypothetical protein